MRGKTRMPINRETTEPQRPKGRIIEEGSSMFLVVLLVVSVWIGIVFTIIFSWFKWELVVYCLR